MNELQIINYGYLRKPNHTEIQVCVSFSVFLLERQTPPVILDSFQNASLNIFSCCNGRVMLGKSHVHI